MYESKNKKQDRIRWEDLESAFKNTIRTGNIINLKHKDLRNFLKDAKSLVERRLKNILKKGENLKVNVILTAKFIALENGEIIEEIKFFNTKNEIILSSKDINAWFNGVIEELLIKVEKFQQNKSN